MEVVGPGRGEQKCSGASGFSQKVEESYVRHYVATETRFVRGNFRQCLLHGWHRETFICFRVGDNMHLMGLLDTLT